MECLPFARFPIWINELTRNKTVINLEDYEQDRLTTNLRLEGAWKKVAQITLAFMNYLQISWRQTSNFDDLI